MQIGVILASIAALLVSPLRQTAGAATVTTLAGSGQPGLADGPGISASFLMPMALAYDRHGDLYVVDAAAQRIRRVRPDGTVDTIAGSGSLEPGSSAVLGGFADGAAHAARFNWPRGIAVAPDGTIYVADTGNHVIRKITPGGRVSVFAGSVSEPGDVVGPRPRARFDAPMGLAVDAKGDVYVADRRAGLRMIDPSGTVTAIPLGHAPTGVTITEQTGTKTLYVVDADGMLIDYPDGRLIRMRSINVPKEMAAGPVIADPAGTTDRMIALMAPFGYPLSVCVLPSDHIFFADPRVNIIRYVYDHYSFVRPMAGVIGGEDASGETAGFRDGDASAARFNAPVATAMFTDGEVAIADAGNRRVRMLHVEPSMLAANSALVPTDDVPDNAYRMVYVGPSWTFYDSVAGDSISGQLQQRLIADGALERAGLVPAIRFVNGVGNLEPLASVVQTIADLGVDKVVLVDLTSLSVVPDIKRVDETAPQWRPAVIARLRAARDILARAHIRLVAVVHPFAMEYSANESPMTRLGFDYIGSGMVPNPHLVEAVTEAARASGVETIDTVPAFHDNAMRPDMPLSGMNDAHYSVRGRTIMATAIARGLERLAPWSKP
jgi:streptogramin lyase